MAFPCVKQSALVVVFEVKAGTSGLSLPNWSSPLNEVSSHKSKYGASLGNAYTCLQNDNSWKGGSFGDN